LKLSLGGSRDSKKPPQPQRHADRGFHRNCDLPPRARSSMSIEMGFIAWIIIGLLTSWLAGQTMKSRGKSCSVNIMFGAFDGVLAGWIFSAFGISPNGSKLLSMIAAFIRAVLI